MVAHASHPTSGGPEAEGHNITVQEPHPNTYKLNELIKTREPIQDRETVQFSKEVNQTLADTLQSHYIIFSEIQKTNPAVLTGTLHGNFLREFAHHLPPNATPDQIEHHAQELLKHSQGLMLAMELGEWEKMTLQKGTKGYMVMSQGPDPRQYVGQERRIDQNGTMTVDTTKPLTPKEWWNRFIHEKGRQTPGQLAAARQQRAVQQENQVRGPFRQREKYKEYYFHAEFPDPATVQLTGADINPVQEAFLKARFEGTVALDYKDQQVLDNRLSNLTKSRVELYQRTGYKGEPLDINYLRPDRTTYVDATPLRGRRHFIVEQNNAALVIADVREWVRVQSQELLIGLAEKVKKQLDEEAQKKAHERLLPVVKSKLQDLESKSEPEEVQKEQDKKDKEIEKQKGYLEGLAQIESKAAEIIAKNEELLQTEALGGTANWTTVDTLTSELVVERDKRESAEKRLTRAQQSLDAFKWPDKNAPAPVVNAANTRQGTLQTELTAATTALNAIETGIITRQGNLLAEKALMTGDADTLIQQRAEARRDIQRLMSEQIAIYQRNKSGPLTGGPSIIIDRTTGKFTTVGGGATVPLYTEAVIKNEIKRLTQERSEIKGVDKYTGYRTRIYRTMVETIEPDKNEQIKSRTAQIGTPTFEAEAREQADLYKNYPAAYRRTIQVLFGTDVLHDGADKQKKFQEISLFLSPAKLLDIMNQYRASRTIPLPPINNTIPGGVYGPTDYHYEGLRDTVNAEFIEYVRDAYAKEAVGGTLGTYPDAYKNFLNYIDGSTFAPVASLTPADIVTYENDVYSYRDVADLTFAIWRIRNPLAVTATAAQIVEAKGYAIEVDKIRKART